MKKLTDEETKAAMKVMLKKQLDVLAEKQAEERAEIANINLKGLVDSIEKKTKAWALEFGYVDKKKKDGSGLSKKGQAVQDFLLSEKADFGCHNDRVATLMSLVLGEDLQSRKSAPPCVPLHRGVVVVPLSNNNGNNYVLNQPALCTGNDWAYSEKHPTLSGNSLTQAKACLRPATRTEIASLLVILFTTGNAETQALLWSLAEEAV